MTKARLRIIKTVKFIGKLFLAPSSAKRDFVSFYASHKNFRVRAAVYQRWFRKNYPNRNELQAQREESEKFKLKPTVSVILPIYNTNPKHLRQCIDSVRAQSYPFWELCVVDDASTTDVIEIVKEYSQDNKNIKWKRLKSNLHIAGASNEALKLASGEFVALLDHDDLLMPNAIFETIKVLNQYPETDIFYSDEDKTDSLNRHIEPFFKPDWSPEFLKSCNYITHFAVLRKRIVDKISGFRPGSQGAQDWDLFLRFTQETQKIRHIPKILYTWRKSAASTAKTAGAKPYAYINQLRVLRDSLRKAEEPASVLPTGSLGFWNVSYRPQGMPLISIIIPTKDNYQFLKRCVESIVEKTSYPYYEVVLVDTGSTDKKLLDWYKSDLKSNYIKLVNWRGKKFNFSSACNLGASKASGEYFLFLNDDTELLTADWLENMLGFAQHPKIGMVGCKLMFPNGHIQHAGVVLSQDDVAFHAFYNQNPIHDIFTSIFIHNVRNCSAVTAACAMVAKDKFNEVGGFDEQLRVTYNDVDLCLRLLKAGYRNVYTPYSNLYHNESISIGRVHTANRDRSELVEAQGVMRDRWADLLARDPYYNDNFVQHGPTGYVLPKS